MMTNKQFALCCLSLLSLLGLTSWLNNQAVKNRAQEVEWMSIEEAQEKAESDPRPIFVNIYADWCAPCKDMENSTYLDPQVAEYLNTHFYPVKMNADNRDAILYQGNTTTAQRLSLRTWMVRGLPAYVLLQPDMKSPKLEMGLKDSRQMVNILRDFEETGQIELAP